MAAATLDSSAQLVVLSPVCGMVHGLLESITPDEGCQIATFSCQTGPVSVALPGELQLQEYVGCKIGLVRWEELYLVRRMA